MRFVVAVLTVFAFSSAFAAEESVMVTDCMAETQIVSAGNTSACEVLMGLAAGDSIVVPAGASATVVHLYTAAEYELGPGAVTVSMDGLVDADGASIAAGTLEILAAIEVSPTDAGLAQAGMAMRGRSNNRVQLESPVDTAILSTRPEFVWESVEGAAEYLFVLVDETGEAILEIPTAGNAVSMPSGLSLESGRYYTWRVEAFMADGNSYQASADFNIADDSLRGQVSRFEPAAGAPFAERVLYATLLQTAGFTELARAHYRRLSEERPDSASLRARAEP